MGNTKVYGMLQSLKMMLVSIRSSWRPKSATNDSTSFSLWSFPKLVFCHYFIFHQHKALKKLWEILFFHLKHSYGFWSIQFFEIFLFLVQSLKIVTRSWKWCHSDVVNWLSLITTCNFWNNSKTLFELRHQKWSCGRSLKKRNFWTYLVTLKGTGSWQSLFLKIKIIIKLSFNIKMKSDFYRIFDNLFLKYLISERNSGMYWVYP